MHGEVLTELQAIVNAERNARCRSTAGKQTVPICICTEGEALISHLSNAKVIRKQLLQEVI